jgi:predicted permease
MFVITALKVLMMIAYGVPGYIFVKTKMVGQDSAKVFAKFLLYICSPALCIQTLNSVDCTPERLKSMGVFFAASLLSQIAVILLYTLVFRKKLKENSGHRVCAVAGACGNVGFLGVPLLKFLFPENPEIILYSAMFSITMNIIGWTLGLWLMTGNRKYIKLKSVIINPSVISFAVGMTLFVTKTKLPSLAAEYVGMFGTMSTFVCMTVLGMRLATKKLSRVFLNKTVYIGAVSKLFVYPLIMVGLFALLPVDQTVKTAAFVLGCCPAATMIQGLAEAYDGDSETAANTVLFTSIICILTIPFMWTIYNALIL